MSAKRRAVEDPAVLARAAAIVTAALARQRAKRQERAERAEREPAVDTAPDAGGGG